MYRTRKKGSFKHHNIYTTFTTYFRWAKMNLSATLAEL